MFKGESYHFIAESFVCITGTFRKPMLDIIKTGKVNGLGIKRHKNGTFILSCVVVVCCVLHLGAHCGDYLYPGEGGISVAFYSAYPSVV